MQAALDALGWSRGSFADRLGIHRNTISKWNRSGEVPGYAAAFLSLAIEIRRLYSIVAEDPHDDDA